MLVSTMAVQGLEPAASPWGSIGRTVVGLLVQFMIATSSVVWPPLQTVSNSLSEMAPVPLGELLPDNQTTICCCCLRRSSP